MGKKQIKGFIKTQNKWIQEDANSVRNNQKDCSFIWRKIQPHVSLRYIRAILACECKSKLRIIWETDIHSDKWTPVGNLHLSSNDNSCPEKATVIYYLKEQQFDVHKHLYLSFLQAVESQIIFVVISIIAIIIII